MFRNQIPQMNANPPPFINRQPNAPAMQYMPTNKVEVIEREKSLFEQSIDVKKKLNKLKNYLTKQAFNKLWLKASTDPFFDLDEEIAHIKHKRKMKGGTLDEDDIYDFGEQKVGVKQAPIMPTKSPKPVKEKKPRKQSEKCTMAMQNYYHDEMVMAQDETKQLYKYIKQLERLIRKLQK